MDEHNILIIILVCILIMLVFAFSVIWFLNRAQKKIIDTKLKEQRIEIELQDKLLQNTIKTQEAERDRISKELHDDVSSQLNIINLNLHILKSKISTNTEVKELIEHIETSLKNSTSRARAISHELMPVILKKFGFKDALVELTNSINLTDKLKMEVNNVDQLNINDSFKLLHVYRIIQELTNNTLKYANAKKIIINFIRDDQYIKIDYRDDGIGFDVLEKSDGLGMGNIQTRIKLLKGEISYNSKPQEGLQVICKIPNDEI